MSAGILSHRGLLLKGAGGGALAPVLVMKDNEPAGTPSSFVDRVGRTWTRNGANTSVAADPGGFGGSCIMIAGGAASNTYDSDSHPNMQILMGGDFTVEAFIRLPSASPGSFYGTPILGYALPSTDGWCMRCNNGSLQFVYPNNGAYVLPITWVGGQTYHVMACRQGSTHFMGIDGVVSNLGVPYNRTFDSSSIITVGISAFSDGVAGNKYIAPRITKGVALYTGATYVVPIGPL